MKDNPIFLIGDIGGTYSRVAYYDQKADEITNLRIYENKNFQCFENVIETYFKEELEKLKVFPEEVVLGVAGPVIQGKVYITNLGWKVQIKNLRKKFGFKKVILKNDLFLLSASIFHLRDEDLKVIKSGKVFKDYPKAFMAIGTGLGISFLVSKKPLLILPSEGGHAPLSIIDYHDRNFIEYLWAQEKEPLWEEILSSRGLENIFEYYFGKRISAPLISEMASKEDEKGVFAIKKFIEFLGRKCYEIAVMELSFGGIYLAGGILKAISNFLQRDEFKKVFIEHFYFSRRLSNLLEKIPIFSIEHPFPVLLGAKTLCHTLLK